MELQLEICRLPALPADSNKAVRVPDSVMDGNHSPAFSLLQRNTLTGPTAGVLHSSMPAAATVEAEDSSVVHVLSAQKKISQNLEMVIAIEERNFEDDEGLDILLVQQDNDERNESDGKMVEGSRDLCEQTVALSHESSFTPITEPETETSSCNDLVMVKAKDDFQLIAHINGNMHIEEDKKGVEVSNYPSTVEGIEGLIDEIQGTEEEKTEDNLLNGLKEYVESSETEDDFQLISHINGVTHIEEEKMGVEESNYPYADEGVDGLIDEIPGKTQPPLGSSLKKEASPTEGCTHENPAMIIAVEEKTQLEENPTCDLNDVIQEKKTEENLLIGFKENVESSEAEEKLRENEECPLTESQTVEFSLEHYNLMAYKENPLIQFQGIEPIVREEKACLDDRFPLSIEPGPDHYTCMVDLFGRADLLQEALNLINSSPDGPHSAAWEALLSATGQHSNCNLAKFASAIPETSMERKVANFENIENKIFDPGICLLQQSLFQ
ncbi:Pentatricopeptide repeat-containing protein [Dendrobium catenatum]|uniref:Pentatricopeptide repeat-containing protein n=1 Tax=Dendrobium catenatum TaxID=906689 RepID=A0A2I0VC30_9ASPA|nr:Pentatricopeptide repeat-containing protein [Dendrobium catenatum]